MSKPNKSSNQHFTVKALTFAVSAALATQALAQNDAENADSGGMLEEVVVTATKREQSVQDIAISVTALTGDMITDYSVEDVLDFDKFIPGAKINYVGSRPSIIMRGAGAAGTNDVAVPMYVDGLYRPLTQQAMAGYFDLERVEVLRGPQGTLFGRNTYGGLINLITKRPDIEAFDWGGSVTIGNYDAKRIEGFVNIPLSDTAALRISANNIKRDPYIENIYRPEFGMRDADSTYVRAQLRWDATDNFDVTFTATDWEDTSNGAGQFAYHVAGVPVNPATNQTNGIIGVLQPRQGTSATGPSGRTQAGQWPEDPYAGIYGIRQIATDAPNMRDISETSFSALANWDFGAVTLRANMGIFEYEESQFDDTDNSPNPTAFAQANPGATPGTGAGYWSQCWGGPGCGLVAGTIWMRKAYQADITLISNGDGPLSWTAGYYLFDNSDRDDNTYQFLFGYNDTESLDQVASWPHWLYKSNGGTKSTALYGQAEYEFNETTRMTVGVRRSNDDRSTVTTYVDWGPTIHGWPATLYDDHLANPGSRFDALPSYLPAPTEEFNRADSDHTSWRIGFQRDVGENGMMYGYGANGFIAGSPKGGGSTDLTDPNEVETIEIGYKATLMEGRMRLNLAYYDNTYEGLSTTTFVQAGNTILAQSVPGGSMSSTGFEAEMHWAVNERLTLLAGLSVDDSSFDNFAVPESRFAEGGDIEIEGSRFHVLDGKSTRFAPDFTLTLDASWDIGLDNGSSISPGILMYHSDDYKTHNVGYFFSFQDAYTTFDARLIWRSADSPLSVQAYVKNLTEEDVVTETTVFSGNRAMVDYNAPRTYGVRVGWNF
jgi:iron complex outermembrane receptor protein